MHKVFGKKLDVSYVDRKGAYLIPFQNDKIGVVQTAKGFFLLGGGVDKNETDRGCIRRECLEETGYTVAVKDFVCSAETYTEHPVIGHFHPIQVYYIGALNQQIREPVEADHRLVWLPYEKLHGNMFLEMQNWALEQCYHCRKDGRKIDMRLLFEMDLHDYADCTRTFVRNSARSIIIHDKKIAMVHSLKYDYYKFPGGGIEREESPVSAMIRETREEAGLVVKPETVRAYGYVHRIQRSDSDPTECFVQDNFYYLCDAEEGNVSQCLDQYEANEGYTLEFVSPNYAIQKNHNVQGSPYNAVMFEREARVLEILLEEGAL